MIYHNNEFLINIVVNSNIKVNSESVMQSEIHINKIT